MAALTTKVTTTDLTTIVPSELSKKSTATSTMSLPPVTLSMRSSVTITIEDEKGPSQQKKGSKLLLGQYTFYIEFGIR